ncbi:ABC transporter related protein [Hydrogenobacter thermophilus TK-6]|uniref:ABC transporter n=1 Tax=Hydrogenobacter thermophilus (strain DSM 6534 / IAM 12695 / TK-6) TaxID=608538 RepID=D3DJJ1_HYDTT|nr:ABC transporter ATP-binding protein [Hydrogenobacter thermophilus]ADO45916.1 ABC transporter related protein [Hydrogenobacter thermophilus TK-6]BAI69993.1 ABC transporter [Hydrogenobacter thermophilus TK-6]
MLLEVESLNLWYGEKHILKDVSFGIDAGEVLCIVGESGSGKSSILASIMGLLPKYAKVSGSVKFKGKEILGLAESEYRKLRGRYISTVFQEPSAYLDPLFKIGTQIEEAYIAHFGKKGAKQKSLQALKDAGIEDAERVYRLYPHHLSGGMKQRVCIAIATVCDPEVVLADEPTTALDVSVQEKILALFRRLRERGKAVIIVTHDFGVVAEVADRVIVLKDGQVVEQKDVFSIFDYPDHPYTKELLSAL